MNLFRKTVIGLFFGMVSHAAPVSATGMPVSLGATSLTVHGARLAQAQRILDTLMDRSATHIPKPSLEVSADSRYAIVSVAGQPARIVISPHYLNSLSGPALQFALAHELAHLHLDHHARLRRVREMAMAATQESTGKDVRDVHHELEFEADRLAMEWCRNLGCTPTAAIEALRVAYGGQSAATPTHPALTERIQLLN